MHWARQDELTEPAMERACTILLPTVRDRYGEVAGIAAGIPIIVDPR